MSNPSVRNICIPPTRKTGKKTIATTTTPIPPNHCINPRHKSNPLGNLSNDSNIVDPVVVKPDIASKKASVNLAFGSPRIKGKAPKMGSTNQTLVVKKKVCWIFRFTFILF